MNWAIKIILKTLMTKISHISWGGYAKGFYGNTYYFNTKSIFWVCLIFNSINKAIEYSSWLF